MISACSVIPLSHEPSVSSSLSVLPQAGVLQSLGYTSVGSGASSVNAMHGVQVDSECVYKSSVLKVAVVVLSSHR